MGYILSHAANFVANRTRYFYFPYETCMTLANSGYIYIKYICNMNEILKCFLFWQGHNRNYYFLFKIIKITLINSIQCLFKLLLLVDFEIFFNSSSDQWSCWSWRLGQRLLALCTTRCFISPGVQVTSSVERGDSWCSSCSPSSSSSSSSTSMTVVSLRLSSAPYMELGRGRREFLSAEQSGETSGIEGTEGFLQLASAKVRTFSFLFLNFSVWGLRTNRKHIWDKTFAEVSRIKPFQTLQNRSCLWRR